LTRVYQITLTYGVFAELPINGRQHTFSFAPD
jgi:hypothetical protein